MDTDPWISVAELLDRYDRGDQAESSLPDDTWLRRMVRWIVDDVGQPRPALGRAGDLCPFVRPAMRQRLLFIEKYVGDLSNEAPIIALVLDRAQTFLQRPPMPPEPASLYKSLLVAFPDLTPAQAPILQAVRRSIKPILLQRGLTCGEFYPSSADFSARNAQVLVARSPIPCIAIRYLSPHDLLFLRSQPDLLPIFAERFPQQVREAGDAETSDLGGDSPPIEPGEHSARVTADADDE